MSFGTDISTFASDPRGDLDPRWLVISGPRVVAEAVARRLTTPTGSLVDDPAYGWDVRQLLDLDLGTHALSEARAQVAVQAESDERVMRADVSVEAVGERLVIHVELLTSDGPARFTLQVSAVTTTLLFDV